MTVPEDTRGYRSGRPRRRTWGPRPAFSLLELVLVLAIIAIASAIAVPRYANALARYRVETSARRIAADLAYARSLARETSGNQTVVFDTDADCYTLAGRDDPDRPGQPYTVSLADRPYGADLTAAQFGEATSVTFNGYGVPDEGGTVRVQVGDYAYLVTVDAESGEITMSPLPGG